jgi:hypothetical protein
MRLWTLHPKYLDRLGLVALWREGLLAQKVLRGDTKGYRHHPQLDRFRAQSNPIGVLTRYLLAVYHESEARGYNFDRSKIGRTMNGNRLEETTGQLLYEWSHLMKKLRIRDSRRYQQLKGLKVPDPHPIFRIIDGGVNTWERISGSAQSN